MPAKIFINNYKWKKAPKLLLPDFDKLGCGYYVPESRHPIYFSTDHKETVEVGFCVVEKMFINETLLFTIDLLSFFDDLSDEWISSYSTIPEEVWDQETLPNILLISKLVIHQSFVEDILAYRQSKQLLQPALNQEISSPFSLIR